MLSNEYNPNFWRRPGWEHKDASDIVANNEIKTAKHTGGLLGFLIGVNFLPSAIEKLDQLADLPYSVEMGLFATGTALATYGLAKLGEYVTRKN